MQPCGNPKHRREVFVTSLKEAQAFRAPGCWKSTCIGSRVGPARLGPDGGGSSGVRVERPDQLFGNPCQSGLQSRGECVMPRGGTGPSGLLPHATAGLEHRDPLDANRRGAARRKHGGGKRFSQRAIGGHFQGVEGVARRGSCCGGLLAGDINPAIGMVNHR